MKKILSVIFAVAILIGSFGIYSVAAQTCNAKYILSAEVNGKTYASGDTITIAPGSTVKIHLNFKNDFYLGSVCGQIFYNKDIFTGATCAFNTSGRVYQSAGGAMCQFADWDKIAQVNKNNWWPDYSATKLAEFKSTHKFANFVMAPNAMMADEAIKNIDERLATFTFKVSSTAKNGATGQIIIPAESVHRKDYKNGRTMCSVYTSSDMTTPPKEDYEGLKYDLSKAVLKFKVVAVKKGDVNSDGAINSSDALLVLQSSVGLKTLTATQAAAADVNSDGNINSSDALKILKYAVGEIKTFN